MDFYPIGDRMFFDLCIYIDQITPCDHGHENGYEEMVAMSSQI